MPAHQPRRHFATPLVITLAAALPACSETPTYPPNPPAPNPPVPTSAPPDVASAAPTEKPVVPTGTAAPPQGQRTATWSITQSGGKCLAMSNSAGGCPPGATCNPPPPRDYPCPDDAIGYPLLVTQTADTQKCSVTYRKLHHVNCPPNIRCNPPPPREVTIDTVCPQ